MIDKTLYTLGSRYTHHSKELCYEASLNAIKRGYQVRYGISSMGNYYYEIVDPWERKEQNNDR